MFGCRVIVHGTSTARLGNVRLQHCGQAGLSRPSLQFDRLLPPSAGLPNPSFFNASVIYRSLDGEQQHRRLEAGASGACMPSHVMGKRLRGIRCNAMTVWATRRLTVSSMHTSLPLLLVFDAA